MIRQRSYGFGAERDRCHLQLAVTAVGETEQAGRYDHRVDEPHGSQKGSDDRPKAGRQNDRLSRESPQGIFQRLIGIGGGKAPGVRAPAPQGPWKQEWKQDCDGADPPVVAGIAAGQPPWLDNVEHPQKQKRQQGWTSTINKIFG